MDKQAVMDTLQTTGIGGAGAGMIEFLHQVPATGTGEIIKYACQGLVALATLVTFWKRNRRRKKNNLEEQKK